MRLLLTGSSGFIGSSLLEGLRRRHEVLAPSHRELDLLDAEAVEAYLRRVTPEVVIHSAVKGGDGVLQETLRMQANLVSGLGRSVRRLVYFGSGAEFAKHRDLRKVSEGEIGERVPRDPYGLAKLYCNEQARAGEPGAVINLRLFGVFGPREGYLYKFISNAVAKALLGIPLVIRQDVRFDYLWVEDLEPVVEHFLRVERPAFADYNVTPTQSVTLNELAGWIRELAGDIPIEVATPGMNFEYTGSNTRLLGELPSLRFTPLKEAIARLWAFYRERRESLDRTALLHDDYGRHAQVRR